MLQNFIIVANQVAVLFILMALGIVSNKLHWLDDKAVKSVTNIVLYFVTPCVIINSFSREVEKSLIYGLIITAVVAALTFGFSIAFAHLWIRDKDPDVERVYRYAAIFGNCGFMALPLEEAVLGDIGTFYGAVYIAVFNLIVWTYGVWLMSGDKSNVKAKALTTNPGLIGTVIGILILVCGIKLPNLIATPISYMASLNTPLPMIIIGYYLGNLSVKKLVSNKKQYLIALYRLILFPAVTLLMVWMAKVDPIIMVVCTIASAAPTAANTAMFATLYGKDAELGAQIMSVTTLISLITLPLLVAFAQFIS
ncbi:MAG: AEC family transporter [Clostridia bacterium]|nr:AEC family transporter [Clostridia bacterium]